MFAALLASGCVDGRLNRSEIGTESVLGGSNPSPATGNNDLDPTAKAPTPYVPPACIAGQSFSTAQRAPRACARPRPIKTGFGGNGHTETWDGRVFIVAKNTNEAPHSVGWVVRVFRPERLKTGADGALDFFERAFSDEVVLETDENGSSHNAIALIAAPEVAENPFASDETGNPTANGAYLTYEILLYAQNYEQNSILQQRRARIIVKDPYSANSAIHSASFLDDFQFVTTASGRNIHAIEPTLSADGRLLIAQGHPKNDGAIDYIIYSYNEQPGSLTGWSEPRFISDMYHVDRDTIVDGIRFADRFPIAMRPLRDQQGTEFKQGEPYHGAYPWISHDGTELFYMATVAGDNTARPGERARRGGASVIGRFTNWGLRHIDGPINPSRDGMTEASTVRLFFSSPGAIGTMWSPYLEKGRSPLPYSAQGPSYPLFGSNTGDYVEVSFEDTLDRNYVLALRMNELLTHDSKIDPTKTPDTSGHYNNGELEGAQFPIEYNGKDEVVGAVGQGLYFADRSQVRVRHSGSLQNFKSGLTVELFAKRMVDLNQDDENRFRYLLSKLGSFNLILQESGELEASVVVNGEELRTGRFGPPLALGQWVHVAFSYDAQTGKFEAFVDGKLSRSVSGPSGELSTSTNDLLIGPGAQTAAAPFVSEAEAIVMLDELRVSDIVRTHQEISQHAYHCDAPFNSQLLADLPIGLNPDELQVPPGSINSDAARELGRALFFDVRLSRGNTTSCASCHLPSKLLTDGLPTALGLGPKFLSRNTPSLLNRAFSNAQFWDGRAASLEEQATMPIVSPDEMDLPLDEAILRLNALPGYVALFQAAFSEAPNAELVAKALAAYQRSLFSGNSRVDRYEQGELTALSESERRGRLIFRGPKGRCLGCHSGSNYSDEQHHNNGSVCVGDPGRSAITHRVRELGAFKTPSLRDVAQTAPYMHDGSLETLDDVVSAYNAGGLHKNNLDTEIRPLGLTEQERTDLVAFLRALDGETVDLKAPTLP